MSRHGVHRSMSGVDLPCIHAAIYRIKQHSHGLIPRIASRCQREYPQPPPPTKNSTTRTINTVSMLYLTCKRKLDWPL